MRLAVLFSNAHFLILPTRAECVANVFAEACCFGLPILATDTGGVATAVLNDVNGHVLPYDDPGIKYADRIIEAWSSPEKYRALSSGARTLYDTTLNWHFAGRRVEALITRYCRTGY
jgi:glycosyltransferase involved in cell wall biosynthesis